MGGSLVLGLDRLSNPQVSRDFGSLHKTARPYLCCCHSWGRGRGQSEEEQGRGRAGQVGGSEVISYMSRCEQMECLAVFRSQAASASLAHRVTHHLPSPNPIWLPPLPPSLPLTSSTKQSLFIPLSHAEIINMMERWFLSYFPSDRLEPSPLTSHFPTENQQDRIWQGAALRQPWLKASP